MWGKKQAAHIEKKLAYDIQPHLLEKFKIKCGDAFEFQGDERDIVLTSMVADQNSRPIPELGLRRKRNEQNYNVAASRAKDCLYLFHSRPPSGPNDSDVRLLYANFFSKTPHIQRMIGAWSASCLARVIDKLKHERFQVRMISQKQNHDEVLAIIVVEDDEKQIGFIPMGAKNGRVMGIQCWIKNFEYSLILTRAHWKLNFLWMSLLESNPDYINTIISTIESGGIKRCDSIEESPKEVPGSDTESIRVPQNGPGSEGFVSILRKCLKTKEAIKTFLDQCKTKDHNAFFMVSGKTKNELLTQISLCRPIGIGSPNELLQWLMKVHYF